MVVNHDGDNDNKDDDVDDTDDIDDDGSSCVILYLQHDYIKSLVRENKTIISQQQASELASLSTSNSKKAPKQHDYKWNNPSGWPTNIPAYQLGGGSKHVSVSS